MPPTVHLSRAFPGKDVAMLRFPYAPLVNEAIKRIPGRVFVKDMNVWTIPLTPDNVLMLRAELKPLGWLVSLPDEVRDDLNLRYHKQQQALRIRDAGDSDIDFAYVTEPYAHQRAGLAFLAHLGHGALLWEMGLGKTKTAIDYAEWLARGEWTKVHDGHFRGVLTDVSVPLKVLVICPNTVKRNWAKEIRKHAGHEDFILPTGSLQARTEQLATARYTILNCEALSYPVMAKALKKINWDLVVVDESTRFKTPNAVRTKTLRQVHAKHRVILTGTPITGKVQDAYAQFEWLAPGTFGNSFLAFKQRYMNKLYFGTHEVYDGMRPEFATELRDKIGGHSYRILKTDVLDLPPKVYSDRRVTLAGDQLRAYAQMRDELRIEIDEMPVVNARSILTLLLRLTQVTAGFVGEKGSEVWIENNVKQQELDGLLNDELAGEQAVIFGLYQFELEQLAKRYTTPLDNIAHGTRYHQPIIYGPTPEPVRADLIESFQRGDRRLLFCQVRTGGIGIDLFAAQTAIFYTRSWSLEEWLQTQDRLHRIGQTGTVSIIPIIAEGTIDVDIDDSLDIKQEVADTLTGDDARQLAARILGE